MKQEALFLSCEITVAPGNGRNRPKGGKTGPVRDFLKDQDSYYREVLKHVRDCGAGCTPDLVLQEYLRRRTELRKFNGETSGGLCDLAERYEKLGATPALVRRFFVLSADASTLCRRADLLPSEVVEGVKLLHAKWVRDIDPAQRRSIGAASMWMIVERQTRPGPARHAVLLAASCYDGERPLPPDEELLRLAEIAAVMLS